MKNSILTRLNFPIINLDRYKSIDCIGDINLVNSSLIGIFSSIKCPASSIIKAHDYAKEIRHGEIGIVSGFRAPAEKEVLEVLLRGTCSIVVVLGRRLEGVKIPAMWKTEIEKGRMLLISPFKEYQKHVTKESSLKCNDLAAHMAGHALIIHASQGGSLEMQIEEWKKKEIKIEYL